VCRNGFGHDLAALLLTDLRAAVDQLEEQAHAVPLSGPSGFHH
jgi:hypothetical protein